jgi:hypothetical protein
VQLTAGLRSSLLLRRWYRGTPDISDEEVVFVASLYRQRLPPPDVVHIIQDMFDEGEIGNKGEGAMELWSRILSISSRLRMILRVSSAR